jgi:hypothetical protein
MGGGKRYCILQYILEVLDARSTPKQHALNAAIASLVEDFSRFRLFSNQFLAFPALLL